VGLLRSPGDFRLWARRTKSTGKEGSNQNQKRMHDGGVHFSVNYEDEEQNEEVRVAIAFGVSPIISNVF
jgi:hypothetical protein